MKQEILKHNHQKDNSSEITKYNKMQWGFIKYQHQADGAERSRYVRVIIKNKDKGRSIDLRIF